MKVKGKELILKIVSLCATVLAFVGLAFKFAYKNVCIAGKALDSASGSITRSNWWDMVDSGLKKTTAAGYTFWQFAKVFMVISLVLLAVLAVLTIIEFFFSHKYLSLAKRIVGIATLVSVVVFFLTLMIGGFIVADKLSDLQTTLMHAKVEISFVPHVCPWFLLVFGLAAPIVSLVDRKKA